MYELDATKFYAVNCIIWDEFGANLIVISYHLGMGLEFFICSRMSGKK